MQISRVFIEKPLTSNPAVKKFIAGYPQHFEIENFDDFDILIKKLNLSFDYEKGKRIIVFKQNKSHFIKKCPCTTFVQPCGYYVMNIIQNCFIGCTYCYLQQYVNNNIILIHPNIENISDELKILSDKNKTIRLGNGEFSDSLLFDKYTGITEFLINNIINYTNIHFEIKTKTSDIKHLLDLDISAENKKKITFAWSVNPQCIIDSEEKFAAPLDKRLAAATVAVKNGYSTSFHFDPVILFDHWEYEYSNVIDMIFENIPADKIDWFSIGAFRCAPELISIIRKKYPSSKTFLAEAIIGKDGKYRYIKPLREKIFKLLTAKIRKYSDKPVIYLCMENSELWRAANCSDADKIINFKKKPRRFLHPRG